MEAPAPARPASFVTRVFIVKNRPARWVVPTFATIGAVMLAVIIGLTVAVVVKQRKKT